MAQASDDKQVLFSITKSNTTKQKEVSCSETKDKYGKRDSSLCPETKEKQDKKHGGEIMRLEGLGIIIPSEHGNRIDFGYENLISQKHYLLLENAPGPKSSLDTGDKSDTTANNYTNGLCNSNNEKTKKEFLQKWDVYLAKLKALEEDVARRTQEGFSLERRMPSQLMLLELATECQNLTEAWYGTGRGNFSCFHRFFYQICEASQGTFYSYQALPKRNSEDGYITLLDMETRAKLQNEYTETVLLPHKRAGGLWSGGRSPIDNVLLSPLRSRDEGYALRLNITLRKALAKLGRAYFAKKLGKPKDWRLEDPGQLPVSIKENLWVMIITDLLILHGQVKQKMILEKLKTLHFDILNMSPEVAKKLISDEKSLTDKGVECTSIAFKLLLRFGRLIQNEDWKDLSRQEKDELHKWGEDALDAPIEDTLYGRFVKYVKTRPGEYFFESEKTLHGSSSNLTAKQFHCRTQIEGIAKNLLTQFKRTQFENHVPLRYWPISWRRTVPLENIAQGKRILLRKQDSQEISRFRVNQGPYLPLHVLSLASSGLPEGLEAHQMPIYNLGIPIDPTASPIENRVFDPEKCLNDAFFLNSKSKDLLSGEVHLTVGQNSVTGSSIKQTQHMQISAGVISNFPIYNTTVNSKPYYSSKISAEVSLVPMGHEDKAFYLKMVTDNPRSVELIQFINDLKMLLLENYGGYEKVDFHFHVIPNGMGQFVIIFSPLTPLEVKSDGSYFNPELGKSHKDLGLPVEHIHLANGSGTWGFYFKDPNLDKIIQQGRDLLMKLWDFTAKQDAKEYVSKFLQGRMRFETSPGYKSPNSLLL